MMSLGILSIAAAVPTFDASHSPMFSCLPSIKRSAHIEHGEAPQADDMLVQVVHGFSEDIGGVAALGRWSLIRGEEKDFVHADMKRFGVEGVDQLVDEREDNLVCFRIEGIPFSAVDALVFGKSAWREIELRMFC